MEKKINVTEMEAEKVIGTEQAGEVADLAEGEEIEQNPFITPLLVKREVSHSTVNKKDYGHYKVYGKINGRDVYIELVPPNVPGGNGKMQRDIAGYAILSDMFGDKEEMPLVAIPYRRKTRGQVEEGYRFYIIDDDGDKYNLIPEKESDRFRLNKFLRNVG